MATKLLYIYPLSLLVFSGCGCDHDLDRSIEVFQTEAQVAAEDLCGFRRSTVIRGDTQSWRNKQKTALWAAFCF